MGARKVHQTKKKMHDPSIIPRVSQMIIL